MAIAGTATAFACTSDQRDADLESFRLHPDFRIELAASEPVVFDPVDLEFDETGRIFVLEMPGYPLRDESGRVVVLGDSDGDGRWDTRRVWAENLPVADSILPYRGGLLVASPPDLLLLRDLDGDGIADERTVLLTGFADENTQHNFNGLTHGLDNWIYGANGGNSGEVFWPEESQETTALRFDDFRIDIERRRFERWGRSSGGFGLTFDSWGRDFATHNLFHISRLVFPGRYVSDLPFVASTRSRISDHGDEGPARIYPIGVQETRVNHPEQSGHFSGACGITAYTGGAFPPGFEDNVFVADVVLNLVHRSVVRESGTDLVASRARPGEEFLASSDRSFRPVNMSVGPDGALYVLDMHRAVIEHPEWIPDPLEEKLDLRAGRSLGRIYRILPTTGLPAWSYELDRGDTLALVEALGHANGWHRTTAQRLLVEEGARDAAALLREAVAEPAAPLRRLHALWALDGLGELDSPSLLALLADPAPRVREHAVRAAERRLGDSAPLVTAVAALSADDDPRVRLQVALSLGRLGDAVPGSGGLLMEVAARLPEDPWTRLAVAAGVRGDLVSAFGEWSSRADLVATPGGRELGSTLARLAEPRDASILLAALAGGAVEDPVARAAVLGGLAEAFDRAPGEIAAPAPAVRRWLRNLGGGTLDASATAGLRITSALGLDRSPEQLALLGSAAERAADPALATQDRIEALAVLAFADFDGRRELLLELLGHRHPESLQLAALDQLTERREVAVGAALLERWRGLGPRVRERAASYFLRLADHHALLLGALEEGRVTLGEMNLHLERRRALLWSDDAEVRRRAEAFFDDAGVVTREAALEAMRPSLALEGDPEAGHRWFQDLCARCHRFGGEGASVGPDLTEISRKSPETLLHDIVDPNAAVEPEYLSYTVTTADGRLLTGLVRDQTDRGLVLVEGDGRRVELALGEIEELRTGGLSLMPEELEAGLEPQAFADLLAYLQASPGAPAS